MTGVTVPSVVVETEQRLLGALMMSGPKTIARVAAILTEDEFFDPIHREMFDAICEVADAENPPRALHKRFAGRNASEELSMHDYAWRLRESILSLATLDTDVASVKEYARQRDAIYA